MARDFYEVLGVARTADQDEIQRAYRTLARKYHPDVNKDPQAEERFKEINEAFSVLSDPEQRTRYDRFGEDFRKVPEDWEERVAAGAGAGSGFWGTTGGGPRVRYSTAGFDGEGVDVEDLFGSLFGGAGRMRVPGADQEAELPLTVEEAYRGGRRTVTLAGPTLVDLAVHALAPLLDRLHHEHADADADQGENGETEEGRRQRLPRTEVQVAHRSLSLRCRARPAASSAGRGGRYIA